MNRKEQVEKLVLSTKHEVFWMNRNFSNVQFKCVKDAERWAWKTIASERSIYYERKHKHLGWLFEIFSWFGYDKIKPKPKLYFDQFDSSFKRKFNSIEFTKNDPPWMK